MRRKMELIGINANRRTTVLENWYACIPHSLAHLDEILTLLSIFVTIFNFN
jgi:hypothetical protein